MSLVAPHGVLVYWSPRHTVQFLHSVLLVAVHAALRYCPVPHDEQGRHWMSLVELHGAARYEPLLQAAVQAEHTRFWVPEHALDSNRPAGHPPVSQALHTLSCVPEHWPVR